MQLLTQNGFIGAIRNLRVNGHLADLNVGSQGQGVNAAAVPINMALSCLQSDGSARCGTNVSIIG